MNWWKQCSAVSHCWNEGGCTDQRERKRQRERNLRHMYKTVQGLLQFHSMILTPNSRSFRASPRLCLCNTYQVAYKSCCLFSSLNYWCWSSIRFPFRATFIIIPLQRLWFGTKWMSIVCPGTTERYRLVYKGVKKQSCQLWSQQGWLQH